MNLSILSNVHPEERACVLLAAWAAPIRTGAAQLAYTANIVDKQRQ